MKYLAAALCLLFAFPVFAQPTTPLFETRAVWFATVLRDGGWPVQGTSASSQELALRERIRRAYGLGMNTFIFQAVSRGDALYPSSRLPWSPHPLGAGQDPGYDPLAVAVDEAHRLGMELHAWVNVFRVGDSNTQSLFQNVTDPQHVLMAHPEWVGQDGSSYWIDPYNDEARAWLVENVLEIVRNYDVDAVHFDFIRYPQGGLSTDGDNFQADPDNASFASIGDWRRNNVTEFVRDANAAVYAEKPWVKVGSTPVGNYKDVNGWPALFGFSSVFQESRAWLDEGINDYLAPQIYWDIANDPRFDVLAEQWVDDASGRPIFVGVGAYVDSVQTEIVEQIEVAREAGAAGQVFFRYDHLLQVQQQVLTAYTDRALPAPMLHRFEAAAPSPPQDIRAVGRGETFTVTWSPATGTASDPVRGYAVFRSTGEEPDPASAEDFLVLVDAANTSFSETVSLDPGTSLFYRVMAFSKLGVPSDASPAVAPDLIPSSIEEASSERFYLFEPVYPNPARGETTFSFEMRHPADVTLAIYDVLGRRVAVLAESVYTPGRYQVVFDTSQLPSGVYLGVLQTEGARQSQQFIITQ